MAYVNPKDFHYVALIEPILDAEEVADLLQCSVKTVETHARSGRLPAVKFGDGWIFSSELLIETIKKLSLEEAEKRSRPVRPKGIAVAAPKHRRKPPGMGHLTYEEIQEILGGDWTSWKSAFSGPEVSPQMREQSR